MRELKAMVLAQPDKTRELLTEQPQLCFAFLQVGAGWRTACSLQCALLAGHRRSCNSFSSLPFSNLPPQALLRMNVVDQETAKSMLIDAEAHQMQAQQAHAQAQHQG